MIPSAKRFTAKERAIVARLRTPAQVQKWLRGMPYNWERGGETCLSFRGVVRQNRAHCLDAAIAAATILEQHGHPPVLVSIESQDYLDHVLFVFRHRGKWGAVARSRDLGLHGRKPAFRSIRDLVWSYFDTYIDKTGRITGYGVADLADLGGYNWQLSSKNVWKVERLLQKVPHARLHGSDARYRRMHRRYLEFRERYPKRHLEDYASRSLWLL